VKSSVTWWTCKSFDAGEARYYKNQNKSLVSISASSAIDDSHSNRCYLGQEFDALKTEDRAASCLSSAPTIQLKFGHVFKRFRERAPSQKISEKWLSFAVIAFYELTIHTKADNNLPR